MSKSFDIDYKESQGQTPQTAFFVSPPLPVSAAPTRGRRTTLMRAFFLAVIGCALIVCALPFAGRDAIAQNATAEESQPSRKCRKMAENESMGITLSIESVETEVKPDENNPLSVLSRIRGKKAKAKSKAKARQAAPAKKASSVAAPRSSKAKKTPVKKAPVKRAKLVIKKTPPSPIDAALADAQKQVEAEKWGSAVMAYNKVLKRDKKNMDAINGKVYALEQMGSDGALDSLDAMADRYPDVAAIHAARARLLVRQKDTLEALAAWKRAIALAPDNGDYQAGLAVLNDRLGREAKALRLYKKVKGPLSAEMQRRRDYLASQPAGSLDGADDEEDK